MQLPARLSEHSIPEFSIECDILVKTLRNLSVFELTTLIRISEKLAVLNVERYRNGDVHPARVVDLAKAPVLKAK
jgi:cytoplasmic iron level regulating protein YaaA (DUF328/UPF0246 family)